MNNDRQTPYTERIGNVTVVTLGERYSNFNEAEMQRLQELLLELPDSQEPPLVVLQMRETEYIASHFLEIVYRGWSRISKRPGSRFALCELSEHCAEVILVTKLSEIWEIYDTLEDALTALQPE